MSIRRHTLPVTRTARYFTFGEAGPQTEVLWLACHGYGQLASDFIHKFQFLDASRNLVVAPEGLSRFYWNGVQGKVGASWMTREERLDEIADYVRYLQNLFDHFRAQLRPDLRIVLMGFSQGCATICRWVLQNHPPFHHLFLWAGLLPDDLDYRAHQDYLADKDLHFVYGLEDEYLTPERLEWHEGFVREQGLPFQVTTFSGKHEVNREVLADFADRV